MFLAEVAQAYADNERGRLADYCFVFPNKRSGTLFAHELRRRAAGDTPLVMPRVCTVSQLTASLSPWAEASRLDQLFLLYELYGQLCADDERPDFDSFMFWGEILLNDFNDVDRYLVDPDRLFVNLERLHEIKSTYLTPEQAEIMHRYWGVDCKAGEQESHFWEHVRPDSDTHRRFLSLWRVLGPLFHGFQSRLAAKGLATQGMMLRQAVRRLDAEGSDGAGLPFARYVFVGFNVLTLAEAKIFTLLQRLGRADFYWDMNSPAMRLAGNRAARFVSGGVKCFPSRYQVDARPVDTWPRIDVEGVPSQTGMAKRAGQLLRQWTLDGTIDDPADPSQTAVVLADQGLLIPMIHAVPDEITQLNVTMGFPLRLTPVASFMQTLMEAAERRADGGRRATVRDVELLLDHPALAARYPKAAAELGQELRQRRQYRLELSELRNKSPELAFLFREADPRDASQVFGYLTGVARALDGGEGSAGADRLFIHAMEHALRTIHAAIDRWGVDMRQHTFYGLASRAVRSEAVAFAGEPLQGLQVMGMLETRGLDYDNLIVLSMNEGVFPRRVVDQSFIPDTLRRGYGMATTDFQESIYSYYFYRLISRAKRVTLLYDNRARGMQTGEPSRYITQLQHLYPEAGAALGQLSYQPPQLSERVIEVPKTPETLRRLGRFLASAPEEERKNLSASAIKTYLNCPLRFYLSYVAGLREDEEIKDYMESSTYGTIVHGVCQDLYRGLRPDPEKPTPVQITPEVLQGWLDKPWEWEPEIKKWINQIYSHRDPDEPMSVQATIIAGIIRNQVYAMLLNEKKLAPFTFLYAEKEIKTAMRLEPKGREPLEINVKQILDRVDRKADGTLRVIDYKTGSDETAATTLEQLFDDSKRHAIMQLMFYCVALARQNDVEGHDGAIQPVIYKMRNIGASGIEPIRFGTAKGQAKPVLADYRELSGEFTAMLAERVADIFDPGKTFGQCKDVEKCQYCPFRAICGR